MPGLLFRYVSARFLAAFALFAVGLSALVIVGDLILRVKGLLSSAGDSFLAFAVEYYAYKTPYILTMILPPSILFAAVFTIMRLAKANELVPMMTGGVSLRRVCLPFLWAAALGVAVEAWIHWSVLPRSWRSLAVMEDIIRGDKIGRQVIGIDPEGNHLSAAVFLREERRLEGVFLTLVRREEGQQPAREIVCDRGLCVRWRERSGRATWRFESGRVYPLEGGRRRLESLPDGGMRLSFEEIGSEGVTVELGITPADLLRKSHFGEHFSIREALDATRRYPHVSHYWMQLYGKLTEPLAPALLLLLGLPFALAAASSRNVFVGLGLCLTVTVAFFSIRLVLGQLGAQGAIPPSAATLLPTLVLGAAGGWMFVRVRT
jgi:lipopolysaccharide export system permease protein